MRSEIIASARSPRTWILAWAWILFRASRPAPSSCSGNGWMGSASPVRVVTPIPCSERRCRDVRFETRERSSFARHWARH